MAPAVVLAQAGSLNRLEAAFVRLVDHALSTPWLALVAVAAAFGVGAVHALAPGHGKAVAGAYLVGGRGRPRDAVVLGVAVAAMHTVSVLALGLGTHVLLRTQGDLPTSVQTVTPTLRIASGIAVTLVGGYVLARQRGTRGHHHGEPDVDAASPFSRRGLVVLGLSGGLLPSPSAFLVLVTTGFLGRLWLGLLLLTVFSLGLATTLTVVGLAAIRGRDAIVRRLGGSRHHRLTPWTARAAGAVVLVVGVVMTAAGVTAL